MVAQQPPLTVQRVAINRLDGIAHSFEVSNLSPGINLIHGPNAAGKSRTAQIIRALIWPEMRPAHAEISGDLGYGTDNWYVAIDDLGSRYQRNGTPVGPPTLAGVPAEQSDRYLVTLHQLLASDNPKFVQEIQRESAGGFDLRAARATAGMPASSPKVSPNSIRRKYLAARETTRGLREKNETLRIRDESLGRLKAEHRAAIAAQERIRLLEDAQTLARRVVDLREAQAALEQFEHPISEMAGNEFDRLVELRKELEARSNELVEANRNLADATRALDSAGFSDGIPPETLIPELRKRHSRLETLLADLQAAQREVERSRATSVHHRQQVGVLDDEQIKAIDHLLLEQLATLTRDFAQAKLRAENLRQLESWLGGTNLPNDVDDLRQATGLIAERLRILGRQDTVGENRESKIALLVASAIIVVLAIVLAVKTTPLAAAIALIALPLVYLALRRREPVTAHRATEIEHRYQLLGLESPPDWRPESLIGLLDSLFRRRTEAEVTRERSSRWADLALDRARAEEQLHDIALRRNEVRGKLGLDFDAESDTLRALVDGLVRWRDSIDALTKAESHVASVNREIASTLDQINVTLTEYGAVRARDATEAQALEEQLERRITRARDALASIDQARSQIEERLVPDRDKTQKCILDLFHDLGVEPDDDAGIRQLCDRVPDYRNANERLNNCSILVAEARARLEDAPDLIDADPVSISAELAHVMELANRRDALQAEISRIETEVQAAKLQSEIESSLAHEQSVLDEMRNARDADYQKLVGWQLGEFLQERTRDFNRPQVFVKARQFFTDFTAGEFRLEIIEGNDPTFMAIDTSSNESRTMAEISSGTRVQLLLAVRLAFIETLEQGLRLPLVLDETLGISDDVRANAIIDATIEICRKGRQVIYFTAQPDEVAKWESRLIGHQDMIPYEVIDLAKARAGEEAVRPPEISIDRKVFQPVEVPDGTDHATARTLLRVGPVDPWDEDLSSIDLWYLIRDVPALVVLRNIGISTWGRYREMRNRGLPARVANFALIDAKADQLCHSLAAALDVWRSGRPRKLASQELLGSNVISGAYTNQVIEIADRHKWDGRAIVDALYRGECSGFRRNKITDLEEYLRDNGYITDIEPRSDHEIRAAALFAVVNESTRAITDEEIDQLLVDISL